MPSLHSRLKEQTDKRKAIETKVSQDAIRPTQNEAEIISHIARQVSEQFRDKIADKGFIDSVKSEIREKIKMYAASYNYDYETQARIEKMAISNIMGLGPIEDYMNDDTVAEIIVQRWDNICIERNGIIEFVDASFSSEEHLITVINRIVQAVNRQINLKTPKVNARLEDGSRVHATIKPVTPDGATLNIRKYFKDIPTDEQFIEMGTLNADMLEFLKDSVRARVNIIVSGGTGAGKTTLLNKLGENVPETELIISVEDTCELKLPQRNVRRMETRESISDTVNSITMQELVKSALRMRPDRIIVGEIRDGTVVDMITAMSTGHEGSLSTVHADSPAILVNSRFPILYSMNKDISFSEQSRDMQVEAAIDMIVHISKVPGGARKITHITHVNGFDEKGRIQLKDIFLYDKGEKQFIATGYIPQEIIRKAKERDIHINKQLFKNKEATT